MSAWNPRANEIFVNAVELASPEERRALLDRECGSDAALREQVEKLLHAHDSANSFLQQPAPGCEPTVVPEKSASDVIGSRIGPYKLLQEIGVGGMGTVFMAEQTAPVKRMVALKVIKPGMDTAQVVARFEAERQALALMDHPNIAKVLDAGTTDAGRPYFVMELVKGVPITNYCDEHQLTPRERMELFVPVCQAIQHAHQKGIIHRDLKPSNVMIASYDGRPVPKVIDFGVAKAMGQQLTERTMFTGFGGIVGTLEYMSPEQAEFNALDVDTRSDIYSLGVLLYELLTGSTPLTKQQVKQAAITELLRIIREQEPPKPSTRLSESRDSLASLSAQRKLDPIKLTKEVSGELDWIVMKALEKDRTRRYETANGLARDLGRYLHDEAVEACPPSAGYRFRKFTRKHKRSLAAAGTLLLALVAIMVSIVVGYSRAQSHLRDSLLHQARALAQTTAVDRRFQALDAVERAAAIRPGSDLLNEYLRCLDLPGLRSVAPNEGIGSARPRGELKPSPGNEPPRSSDDPYWLWTNNGQMMGGRFAFRGDHELVGVVGRDPRLLKWKIEPHPSVLDIDAGRPAAKLPGIKQVNVLALSRDGRRLIVRHDKQTLQVWNLDESKVVGELKDEPLTTRRGNFDVTLDTVMALAFNADASQFAIVRIPSPVNVYTSSIHVYEVASLRVVAHWIVDGRILDVGFHPTRPMLTGNVVAWRFQPGGNSFTFQEVHLWNLPDGKQLATLNLEPQLPSGDWIQSRDDGLAFSANGEFLFAGSRLGTVKAWEMAPLNDSQPPREVRSFAAHSGRIGLMRLSPDGRWLATAGENGELKLWDVASGRLALAERRNVRGTLESSSSSSLLLTGTHDGKGFELQEFVPRDSTLFVVPDVSSTGPHKQVGSLVFSSDDRYLACGDGTKVVDLPNRSTSSLWTGRGRVSAHFQAFSHDGTKLWVEWGQSSNVYQLPTRQSGDWKGDETRMISSIAFDPSGARIAAGWEASIELKVLDTDSNKELWSHTERMFLQSSHNLDVLTTPDGARVTARFQAANGAYFHHNIKTWDIQSGTLVSEGTCDLVSPLYLSDGVHVPVPQRVWEALLKSGIDPKSFTGPRVEFSGDGAIALILLGDGQQRLYSMDSWEPLRTFTLSANVFHLNRDGSRLAGLEDKHLVLWDAADGHEVGRVATAWGSFAFVTDSPTQEGQATAEAVLLIDADRQVQSWRPGEELKSVCTLDVPAGKGFHGRVTGPVQVSQDGRRAAFVGNDFESQSVALCSLPDGKLIRQIVWENDRTSPRIRLSADGRRLAILKPTERDKVWNADNNQELLSLDSAGNRPMLSRDASHVGVVQFQRRDQVPLQTPKPSGPGNPPPQIWNLTTKSLVPDDSNWTFDWDRNEIFRVPDGNTPPTRTDPKLPIIQVIATGRNHTRTLLAAASDEGTILLANARTGDELATLHPNLDKITQVSLSPSGRWLAAADSRGVVQIWDLEQIRYRLRSAGLDW